MEKLISNKVSDHVESIKSNLTTRINIINKQETITNEDLNTLLEEINAIKSVVFSKEDFATKRNRTRNTVHKSERCIARKSAGEQCSHRKQEGKLYCGTHSKGTPHGVISDEVDTNKVTSKVAINVIDIDGILYHVDSMGNVYDPIDIVSNAKHPKVISKYEKHEDGTYTIPSLFASCKN
tara:strand:+ start:375 stop:914 length:540 start_codon:yes stop_codon:yes gene_type:complete